MAFLGTSVLPLAILAGVILIPLWGITAIFVIAAGAILALVPILLLDAVRLA
jgi:hypothetical protein